MTRPADLARLGGPTAELSALVAVPAEIRSVVDTVETALGSGRVAKAFTAYAAEEILPELRSVLSRADSAVQGVTQAVSEYLRADDEMRARTEAAAAAVLPGARLASGPAAAAGNDNVPRPVPAADPQPGGGTWMPQVIPRPWSFLPEPGCLPRRMFPGLPWGFVPGEPAPRRLPDSGLMPPPFHLQERVPDISGMWGLT